jgi:hypothetical protein
MSLANDSITVTPGSGATVATHLAGGKEHQVVMLAEASGQLVSDRDLWCINIPSQVHVAAASTVHWDLFNASSTLRVRVHSIRQIPNIVTAVTGVAKNWRLERTTSVGTGGTGQTAWSIDTAMAALSSDITCRAMPTGGAASGVTLWNYPMHSEETNAGAMVIASLGGRELVPLWAQETGIVLRENQGLSCLQLTNSAQGNTGWQIVFSVV